MDLFRIIIAVACIFAAVLICVIIIRRNYDPLYEKTPLGWWLFAIGITQVLVVAATFFLFEEWWLRHEWLALISGYMSIGFGIIYGIIEIARYFRK